MKAVLLPLLAVGLAPAARAQGSHAATEAALYRAANTPAAARQQRAELSLHAGEFLSNGTYQVGYLHLLGGRRVLMPGLRYHIGQRVVQAQDSLAADSTHYWPLAALRGFDLGTEDDVPPAGAPAVRRYRTRLVQETHQEPRSEAVEVLTATDAGPLLLGWLTQVARSGPLLVAGPGGSGSEPLRPLELSQTAVLRLCGSRAKDVQAFAASHHLRYDQPAEVAQLLDHYNRLAVAKF